MDIRILGQQPLPLLPAFYGACLLFLLLGVAMFCVGWRIRRRKVRSGQMPHCVKCDYNLTGIASTVCPECGTPLSDQTVALGEPHVVKWRVAAGWLACLLGAAVVLFCIVVAAVASFMLFVFSR